MAHNPSQRSTGSKSKILVWRPEVHKRFGEDLYYFLIRFSQLMLENLERSFKEDMELRGYCLYSLFGPYDCLLRVWLNPIAYNRFIDALKSKPFIAQVIEFNAVEQNYWIFRKRNSLKHIQEIIASYSPDQYESAQKGDDQVIIREMEKQGLLATETPSWNEKVKFFIALSEPGPTGVHRKEVLQRVDEITSQFERKGRSRGPLQELSIYSGRGFASTLVKGVVPDIYTLMQIAQSLRLDLGDYSINTETFIVGQQISPEMDSIQESSLQGKHIFSTEVHAWIEELYAPSRAHINPEHLRQVESFLLQNGLYRHLDFSDRFWLGRLITALIRQSVSDASGAPVASDILSSWFRGIESWIRDKLDIYLTAVAQGDAKKRSQLSKEANKPRDTKFAALGDLVGFMGSLAQIRYSSISTPPPDYISSKHLGLINNAVSLRNRVQHNDTGYLYAWEDTINTVAEFLVVWGGLRREVEDCIASWEKEKSRANGISSRRRMK